METAEPPHLHLFSLPNEVFVQILSPFPTGALLPLTTVCQRFHALVLRILHYRLLLSASLKEYKLILECFHPTSKLVEPHVFCQYLGTDGLSDKLEGEGSLYDNVETAQQLGRLGSLYSRFRPEVTVEEKSGGARMVPCADCDIDSLVVTRPVALEEDENFSQLCVVVNIVKVMAGTNLLLSTITVEDGVIRVFRDWLKERAEKLPSKSGHCREKTTPCQAREMSAADDSRILWVGQNKNVGIKVRVRERNHLGQLAPILIHRDEDPFTSYDLYIDGTFSADTDPLFLAAKRTMAYPTELYIRTTRLLMTMEQSLQEQQNYPKAVIFTRSFG